MKDSNEISYTEVNLPFDKISSECLRGENIAHAVASSLDDLPEYRVHIRENSVKAYRGSWLTSALTLSRRPSVEFDIRESEEYYHLLAEIEAPENQDLENLRRDLEKVEKTIDSYLQQDQL
jgi:hypothetical protein